MHQIQLNEQLYLDVQRRAMASGFVSVDEYVADVLKHELREEPEDLDHLFTPQRLAQIERAAAQIKAGESFTSEQVREHFRQRREA